MTEDNTFNEFYAECDEIQQRVTGYLSTIESTGSSVAVIDPLYRDIHTLKGTSQLFGLSTVGVVAHAMEASLEPVRSKKCTLPPSFVDRLLKCLDLIARILEHHRSTGVLGGATEDEIHAEVGKLIDEVNTLFGTGLKLTRDGAHRLEIGTELPTHRAAPPQEVAPAPEVLQPQTEVPVEVPAHDTQAPAKD
ncbi:MAG: Hpt domain-containing protein, partial [Bdellovibrionota bacterium]